MNEEPPPARPRRRRLLLAAGLFLAPPLALTAALLYPPTGDWLRAFQFPGYFAGYNGRDVSLEDWRGSFALVDVNGARRTMDDYRGKAVLVAFGYTHCPDACPTTLARLAQVRQALGTDADKVQVLFVTIDPERDGAELLRNYLGAFDPSFAGLRGSAVETDAAARAFHADYRILQKGHDILVEHTVDVYLVDPSGRVRVVFPVSLGAQEIAQDVRTVLRSAGLCWPWSAGGARPATALAAAH